MNFVGGWKKEQEWNYANCCFGRRMKLTAKNEWSEGSHESNFRMNNDEDWWSGELSKKDSGNETEEIKSFDFWRLNGVKQAWWMNEIRINVAIDEKKAELTASINPNCFSRQTGNNLLEIDWMSR